MLSLASFLLSYENNNKMSKLIILNIGNYMLIFLHIYLYYLKYY